MTKVASNNRPSEINKNPKSENILPEKIQKFLLTLPEDERKKTYQELISVKFTQFSSIFSGPLPPPEILKGYNEIIPNGADRIVTMAEKQSDHRMELEKTAIKEQLKQSGRGQKYGLFIGVFGILVAGFLAYTGHDWVAGIFGTSTIVGLVAVFVLGKKKQEKNLEEKQK
jgi:uncharacterized membrane protein